MEIHKTRAVGVDLENHAIAAGAALLGRAIKGAARKYQSSFGAVTVAVGKKTGGRIVFTRTKSMQEGERSIGVDREHCPSAVGAAVIRRPIQGVAGQNQSAILTTRVAVGGKPKIVCLFGGEIIHDSEARAVGVDGEECAAT